ncbi:MAG: ribbon-helix-helix domain-containing protein [Candidatus Kariarchaeaceae archaeon]
MTTITEKESVTFRLREDWKSKIDSLVKTGEYDSMSAFLRKCVRKTLIGYGLIDGLAESSNEEKEEDTSKCLNAHEEVSSKEEALV